MMKPFSGLPYCMKHFVKFSYYSRISIKYYVAFMTTFCSEIRITNKILVFDVN